MQPIRCSSVHAGGASCGPRRRLRARRCAGVGVGRVPALAASFAAFAVSTPVAASLTATSLTTTVSAALSAAAIAAAAFAPASVASTTVAATIATAIAAAHTVAAQVDAAVRRARMGV